MSRAEFAVSQVKRGRDKEVSVLLAQQGALRSSGSNEEDAGSYRF